MGFILSTPHLRMENSRQRHCGVRSPRFSRSEKYEPFTFKPGHFPPLPHRLEDSSETMEDCKNTIWDQFPAHGLRVTQSHGPGMLMDMLHDVTSVMQHVRSVPFARNAETFRTSPYEYEAVSLVHSIDLRLATYPSAYHLFCIDSSMEVDVRRLFCLIEVENAVADG